MASTNKHPLEERAKDIEMMIPYWDRVDAIVEGHDAMKEGKQKFLPRFPKEADDEYNFRLSISKFTNIYRDVLEGLATKPFEKEVGIIGSDEVVPQEIREFVENVDGSGNNLTVFSALTFFNGINSAIDWIFVDYPTIDTTSVINRAQAREMNIQPFWTHVLARNVLEVRTEIIGSREVLKYIRVFEPALNKGADHVRIFNREGSVVSWQLHEKAEGKYILVQEGTLSIPVIPFVPFITGRRDGKSFRFYPAMKDAADLQIVLYNNESALEFIKTMAGYPMLAANGMTPEKDEKGQPKKVEIGPMRVLYGVPNGNGQHGQWSFIEPQANSMEFLKKSIDSTKQDLRELGRQPLTALSTQLTTVTTSIAAGKAKSAVSAWALGLKDALENALVITALWMGIEYDPEVNVYTGFDNVRDDGSDLDELGKARDRGDVSQETYLFELQRRGVLSPEFNIEDERERILNEIPSDNSPDSPALNGESSDENDPNQPNSDDDGATIG